MNTVVGLSNISFGLPTRDILNATFLTLLKADGLSLVIANPMKLLKTVSPLAKKVLLNKDPQASRYIAHYSQAPAEIKKKEVIRRSPREDVTNAILDGNGQEIVGRVQGLLVILPAQRIVHEVMIPAINRVGDLFESKRYFLPQLVASAEAVKKAFQFLEPHLKTTGAAKIKKTVVILATVQGDIHDIGKNIVSLMLKNHGFDVVDLGKDVSTKRVLGEIKRHRSPIVALSALMTTTMVNMKEVIQQAKKQRLSCRFMVGGAVVTRDYAKELGAAYSKDGVEAVKVARQLSLRRGLPI